MATVEERARYMTGEELLAEAKIPQDISERFRVAKIYDFPQVLRMLLDFGMADFDYRANKKTDMAAVMRSLAVCINTLESEKLLSHRGSKVLLDKDEVLNTVNLVLSHSLQLRREWLAARNFISEDRSSASGKKTKDFTSDQTWRLIEFTHGEVEAAMSKLLEMMQAAS